MRYRTAVAVLLAFAAAGAQSATAGVASAHVTASAVDAAPGENAVVTLRVPTESETASTVALEVVLPEQYPLATVRHETTPGWDVTVRRTALSAAIVNGHGGTVTEVVSSVTFRARDGAAAIRPGEFAEFRLQLGPLPAVSALALPAIQTYSDGTVVSWVEQSVDGTEPEKPAPILRISDTDSGHSHGAEDAPAKERESTAVAKPGHDDPDTLGIPLGGAALVVALVALALAGLPLVRRKSAE